MSVSQSQPASQPASFDRDHHHQLFVSLWDLSQVSLATSTDLVNWTYHGPVLTPANRPFGILYSPWVAQSPATGLYVLWVNILPVIDGHGDFEQSW